MKRLVDCIPTAEEFIRRVREREALEATRSDAERKIAEARKAESAAAFELMQALDEARE